MAIAWAEDERKDLTPGCAKDGEIVCHEPNPLESPARPVGVHL
jgi:hypothetical protein